MKKQTEEKTETIPENDTNKTKTKNKSEKTTSKSKQKQKQNEEENKKLRGYWVNLARKNRNQLSKDVLSKANQPSVHSSDTVQSYSQIQVDCEPQTCVGLYAPKECSRNNQLATPILESED